MKFKNYLIVEKNQKDEVQELLDKAENELASVRKAQMAKSKEENKIKEQLKNEKKEKEELLQQNTKYNEKVEKYKKAISKLKERVEILTNEVKENKEDLAATKSKAINDLENEKKEKNELQEQINKAGPSLQQEEKKWKELFSQEKSVTEELLTKNNQLTEELLTTKKKGSDDLMIVIKEREELKQQLDKSVSGREEENKWKELFGQEKRDKEELLAKNDLLTKEVATTKAKAKEDLMNVQKKQAEIQEQLAKAGSLQEENQWKVLFTEERKEKENLLEKNNQLTEELATTKTQAIDDLMKEKKETG